MAQVDVLIPTYNRKCFLSEALEKLFSQTFQDFRIVIYDDGSTDGTQKHIPKDRRIVFHRSDQNRGVGYARNALLDAIESPVACWQDSDDISHPLRLEQELNFIREGGFEMVFTQMYFFHHPNHYTHTRTVHRIDISRYTSFNGIVDNTNFATAMFLTATRSIQFDEERRNGGEDVDWIVRLAEKGTKFGLIQEPLYYVRRHPGRLTARRRNSV